uniref:PHD-type domain-containing protein n=1 Tax=Rhabditophanes sp. KR3021 TaxID=114890 RepID=A0AC35U539_9BILA
MSSAEASTASYNNHLKSGTPLHPQVPDYMASNVNRPVINGEVPRRDPYMMYNMHDNAPRSSSSNMIDNSVFYIRNPFEDPYLNISPRRVSPEFLRNHLSAIELRKQVIFKRPINAKESAQLRNSPHAAKRYNFPCPYPKASPLIAPPKVENTNVKSISSSNDNFAKPRLPIHINPNNIPMRVQPQIPKYSASINNNNEYGICGSCKKEINKARRGIRCTGFSYGCDILFHQECTDLEFEAFNQIINHPGMEWICTKCNTHPSNKQLPYRIHNNQ